MTKPHYFLKPGYRSRPEPEYFVDEDLNAVWQPDVYPETASLARLLGARKIVDVGCGTAAKLVALHPEFEVVGIDFGPNIEACRERYDFGTWIETDFDQESSLGYDDIAGALLVCADVIEHLIHPERLVQLLRRAIDEGAVALVLSTPERELYNEPGNLGPPPNPAHVREWASDELRQFLASEGIEGYFGLTRSNDVMPYMQTIFVVAPGDTEAQREQVAAWWEERQKWERLAVEQDRTIAELTGWMDELKAASDWREEERARWQRTAEEAHELLATIPVGHDEVATSTTAFPDIVALDADRALVTVITEADPGTDLAALGASLAGQSLRQWEWAIVTTDEGVDAPTEDSRTRVVRGPSRVQALKSAVAGAAEFVVLLDAEMSLPAATAFEKWLWFMEAHPACETVREGEQGEGRGTRMVRRSSVDRYGGVDAALGAALPSGFIPSGRAGLMLVGDTRLPEFFQSPNEWLPERLPFRNRWERSGRHLLLIAPWMTVGGADKFNLDLLDELIRLGWRVTVVTTNAGSHDWYPFYEQRTTDLFPLSHFLRLVDYPRFLRYLIGSRQPDVVLVSNSELGYRLLPYVRSVCPETPLVDYCHSEAEDWNNGGYPRFAVEYREQLDLTITTSEHLRDWMVARGGNAERIEVSYANVDADTWHPDPAARRAVRQELGLDEDEPIVLFTGRISNDKQPLVLAETFHRLAGDGVRFTGIIAGDGPDRAWLEGFLRRRHLQQRVRVVGAVDARRVAQLMAGSDIFFLPSSVEGVALTLYEALACGIPVVGARVGGQPELVTDDVGILVERSTPDEEAARYADALSSLLRDPDRRRRMGLAARTRVETSFRVEQMGGRMNELLETAIERHRSAPGPVPSRELGRVTATEAVELVRVANLADWLFVRASPGGIRSVRAALFFLLRDLGAAPYRWALGRGWTWVRRLKSPVERLLVGRGT